MNTLEKCKRCGLCCFFNVCDCGEPLIKHPIGNIQGKQIIAKMLCKYLLIDYNLKAYCYKMISGEIKPEDVNFWGFDTCVIRENPEAYKEILKEYSRLNKVQWEVAPTTKERIIKINENIGRIIKENRNK